MDFFLIEFSYTVQNQPTAQVGGNGACEYLDGMGVLYTCLDKPKIDKSLEIIRKAIEKDFGKYIKKPLESLDNTTSVIDTDCFQNPHSTITQNQKIKYQSIEYANSLLPKNHRIVTNFGKYTVSSATGVQSLRVYGNPATGRVHTRGMIRSNNPYAVFDNVHDGQKNNEYARLVQDKLLQDGYNMHMITLYAPHDSRTDVRIRLPLLNKARQKFITELQRVCGKELPKIDLSLRLTSLENAVTRGNGFNSHYHIVWAMKGRLTASEKRKFQRIVGRVWRRMLVNRGIIDRKDERELNICHVKYNYDNALVYATKYEYSYHMDEQIADIARRWQSNESITIFELLTLGRKGLVAESVVKKHYRGLLTAMKGIEKTKYSKALNELCVQYGLLERVQEPVEHKAVEYSESDVKERSEPIREKYKQEVFCIGDLFDGEKIIKYQKRRVRKRERLMYDPVTQMSFAEVLEHSLIEMYERAKRPRYKRINDTNYDDMHLLAVITGKDLDIFKRGGYGGLAVLNKIRADYNSGRLQYKPYKT